MGTNQKRRKFSTKFKVKVALEAIKERETTSELAKRYSLHPNQIAHWKRQFIDNADKAFDDTGSKSSKDNDKVDVEKLYQKIGKLEVERDFLKKSLWKTRA
jgi:transposase